MQKQAIPSNIKIAWRRISAHFFIASVYFYKTHQIWIILKNVINIYTAVKLCTRVLPFKRRNPRLGVCRWWGPGSKCPKRPSRQRNTDTERPTERGCWGARDTPTDCCERASVWLRAERLRTWCASSCGTDSALSGCRTCSRGDACVPKNTCRALVLRLPQTSALRPHLPKRRATHLDINSAKAQIT